MANRANVIYRIMVRRGVVIPEFEEIQAEGAVDISATVDVSTDMSVSTELPAPSDLPVIDEPAPSEARPETP